MIQKTRSAEELAGILAHEMQHVLHRHATQAILQHASTSLLLSAMAGDAKGAMMYGIEGARIVGMLRYSRNNEEEADREAVRMLLVSGIDPTGMVTFFERIRKEKELRLPVYLSTHPDLGERIERLRVLIKASPSPSPPGQPLPEAYWQDLKRACKN